MAIDRIGAKRVVLDTIENLFAGLTNQGRVFYKNDWGNFSTLLA